VTVEAAWVGFEPTSARDRSAPVERRLADDAHLDATVLLRELRSLGFERSYQTLTRELRRLAPRPECADMGVAPSPA
jgi:hypothetical protein